MHLGEVKGPILVTGASGTLGQSVARMIIDAGAPVILHASSHPERLHGLVNDAASLDVQTLTVTGPLDNYSSCESMVNTIREHFDSIEGIAMCHGSAQIRLFQDMNECLFSETYRNNLLSVAHVLKAAAPILLQQHRGTIVILSSMWGVVGASMEAWYSAQKAAVHALVKSLAKEWGPSGIRVNGIAAGFINSPMNAHLNQEDQDAFAKETPLGRLGTPEDISPMMMYLLSSSSEWMTGQIITIDGGFTL